MTWIKWACAGGCLTWLVAAATAQGPEMEPFPLPNHPACQPPLFGGPTWNPSCPPVPAPPPTSPPPMPPADKTTPNPTTPNPTTPNPTTPNPATPNQTTPNPTTPNPATPQSNQDNTQNQNQNQEPNQAQTQNNPDQNQNNDAFAQGSEAGTQGAGSVAPTMFGDLLGVRGRIINVIAPEPLHASYKIAENESPQPQDRASVSYNFYDNIDRLYPSDRANLDRETIAFEKSNGDCSFGMRLPFLQETGDQRVRDTEIGDLSLIYKQTLLDDCQTGSGLSSGMVVTVPTGRGLQIAGESKLHSTVFQPFIGYVYNLNNDCYLLGFSSVAVPTDLRDVTLIFNSVGVGYYVYGDCNCRGCQTSISPQLEVHVNTPMDHRGLYNTPLNFSNSVDMTAGVRALRGCTEFGAAVGAPLTGPRPYDFEANAVLTFHW